VTNVTDVRMLLSQYSIKTPFEGDWWFSCHFVPNLFPYRNISQS